LILHYQSYHPYKGSIDRILVLPLECVQRLPHSSLYNKIDIINNDKRLKITEQEINLDLGDDVNEEFK
jgi:hypothetical protein